MIDNTALAPSLAGQQKDVARSRILRAAGSVLAKRGLSATMDDVAAAAGVNRRTIFRHFATRDGLFVAAIRAGVRRYGPQMPAPPEGADVRGWLLDVLLVTHQLNARNGRVFWELTGVQPAGLSAELAAVAAECRDRRNHFAAEMAGFMWRARGGQERPPVWLVDVFAVHLSGFTTQALTGDLSRSPDAIAHVSAQALDAALTSALATSL